jgi:hypothetical protein
MKVRLLNTLLARPFLRDRLPLQLGVFPGEIGYRTPLLQAVVGHSQLEGFDSDFALTRKLTAKFGRMTCRSRLGQEKSRSRYGLLFSRGPWFACRFTCRADSCLARSLIGQRCSHGRHLDSLSMLHLSSSLRCKRPFSRSPTICCSEKSATRRPLGFSSVRCCSTRRRLYCPTIRSVTSVPFLMR